MNRLLHRPPIRRWEVYKARLDPTCGQEQRGVARPVVIIGTVASRVGVVTVIPLTNAETKDRDPHAWEVPLSRGCVRPDTLNWALPSQIRAISIRRLQENAFGFIGNPDDRLRIENSLLEHLEIEFDEIAEGTGEAESTGQFGLEPGSAEAE